MARINWNKFHRYNNDDLEYKDQARSIICKSLGFEPPIHISVVAELTFRQNLRKIALGEISNEVLNNQIEIQTDLIINQFIPNYAPELQKLVKSKSPTKI